MPGNGELLYEVLPGRQGVLDLPRSLESLPFVPFPLPRWTAVGSVGCRTHRVAAFPDSQAGRRPRLILSRPAQDSLALRPERLRSRRLRDLTPRLRHARLPSRIAWVAIEVNRKLLGRISHPLVPQNIVAH